MEPQGSLPYSQNPATETYPQPLESSSQLHTMFLSYQFQKYPPIYM
jgi:hypothetical protein